MKTKEDYLNMQKSFYEGEASRWSVNDKNPVVGSYHQHNEFADYDKYLFPKIDTSEMIALEYGCGPGRNLIRFYKQFKRIDGVDIGEKNINNALININDAELKVPNLYVNSGDNIPTENEVYDIVFSVICLQHICVYEIRYKIMQEVFRVLKTGGYFCFQMGYGNPKQNSVDYYANNYESSATNGENDVCVENHKFLEKDLTEIGFKNFEYNIDKTGPGDGHGNWIWVKVQK
jgi:ubiquinone/menaquinone biosynthesis C-methylase UbiE